MHRETQEYKEYQRNYHRKWRLRNPDYAHQRWMKNKPHLTMLHKLWLREHPDYWEKYYRKNKKKRNEYLRLYMKSPEVLYKKNARNRAEQAVWSGKIKIENCNMCDESVAEMHHEDYSKPLKVEWLCKKCHRGLHRTMVLNP